jgi:hypothetical protein
MAQCSASLEHARVSDLCRGCGSAGAHDAAKRVVPGEVVQRHGAAKRRIPCQGYEHVGDHAAGGHDDEAALQEGFQAAGSPDVVIGTRDWGTEERFLRDPESEETVRLGGVCRWHIRIVLQEGERWYLNLLVSETAPRSRITSEASAKLVRESEEDECIHLRDVNGIDVSISVDMVDTTEELVAGEILPPRRDKPHMLLTMADALRIQGMMLTGWKGESDLLRGWASQGAKKDQAPQGIQGREAGEQARFR